MRHCISVFIYAQNKIVYPMILAVFKKVGLYSYEAISEVRRGEAFGRVSETRQMQMSTHLYKLKHFCQTTLDCVLHLYALIFADKMLYL